MIGKFLATLFLSRDLAHREHLKTKSYAEHVALGSFYDAIVDLADSLAEMYQGRHGIIKDIPLLDDENESSTPADLLASHLEIIEEIRYEAVEKTDTAIQNKIDEVVAEYLTTLYKLRNLK